MRKEGELIKTIPGNNWDRGKTGKEQGEMVKSDKMTYSDFLPPPPRKQ